MNLDDGEGTRVTVRAGPFDHKMSMLSKMFIERGTIKDWELLEVLHYKQGNTGVGPVFWRVLIEHSPGVEETIGVMMLVVPSILDAGRNIALPHMKPNQDGVDSAMQQRMRVSWLNRNVRLSSRTVVDTMYRGAGVGYRLRNLGFRMSGFRFLEGRSSMSRYNPFYFKAGMQAVTPRTASALEQGLALMSRHFTSPPYDIVAIQAEIDAMPVYLRDKVMDDIRAFYFRHSSREKSGEKRSFGMDRINSLPVREILKQVMQLTFGATIYAIFKNPDHGRVLPARLPLTAFDNQAPTAPLRLDLL